MGGVRQLAARAPAVPKQLEKAVQAGQQRRAERERKRPQDKMHTVLSEVADKLGG